MPRVIQIKCKDTDLDFILWLPKQILLITQCLLIILESPLSEVVWDDRPRTKHVSGLLPVFVHKVLWESSYAHLFVIKLFSYYTSNLVELLQYRPYDHNFAEKSLLIPNKDLG